MVFWFQKKTYDPLFVRSLDPNYIALHVGKQGARSAKTDAMALVFEKPATEPKLNLDAKTLLT